MSEQSPTPRPQPGIYLVHKPVGPTSFSVVQQFHAELAAVPGRRLHVCHGGTLDPFAEGLLLVLVGQATRLFELLHAAPKTYVAELQWGVETDTGDHLGRALSRNDASGLTPERIARAAEGLLGWQDQVPPATSAKKVGGEPAYRKVHRGEEVVLPPSRVYLHRVRFLEHRLPHSSRVELVCRGGFYVRAFARDLGRALGPGAHLSALARTAIGPWADPGPSAREWVHGPELLPWAPVRVLGDQEVGALRRGARIPTGALRSPSYRFPEGFPEPADLPVLGVHLGRLTLLLDRMEQELAMRLELPGGL